MIANAAIEMEKTFQDKVGNCDHDDMEADDHQGADGEVGDERESDVVKDLTAVEHAKEKTDVHRIEEHNV